MPSSNATSSNTMPPLIQLMDQTGYSQCEFAKQYSDALGQWCDQNQALYVRVCENKPESAVERHLLGLLTKSHIELCAVMEQHRGSTEKMQALIKTQLGEHANKFRNAQFESILIVTDFWIYVQGYLKMDFSLAYDHASNTLELIKPFIVLEGKAEQEVIGVWMKSFYLGLEASPIPSLTWFERIRNRFF